MCRVATEDAKNALLKAIYGKDDIAKVLGMPANSKDTRISKRVAVTTTFFFIYAFS